MLLRLCQLKSLIVLPLILSACSFFKGRNDTHTSEIISLFQPEWFTASKEHSLQSTEGRPVTHMFFDVAPAFTQNDRFVNAFITTPQNSAHHYRLDLISGQRYYTHTYCPQGDVWGKEKGTFSGPKFSLGYIPKVLDQLGEPQKVVIFMNPGKQLRSIELNDFRIRLIGAYVEQSCPEGTCLGKSNWLSRMVFLAVDASDEEYGKYSSFKDLEQKVSWSEIRPTLENLEGRNQIGENTSPFLKIGEPIAIEDALAYFKKRSIFMSKKELSRIRKGCHALYEKMWTDVGAEKPEDKPVHDMEGVRQKAKIREELKKKNLPVGFAARFRTFTAKYYDEFLTCSKFVYAGNVNLNQEKFWFLAFTGIFYQLNKDGYYFDCKKKSWQKNSLDVNGQPLFTLKRDLEFCSAKDLDLAMSYLPGFLNTLKSGSFYYRFIDYDNHAYGTHNKMYSWIRMPVKTFDCSNDVNQRVLKESRIFPDDIRWKNRYIEDAESKMKIIY